MRKPPMSKHLVTVRRQNSLLTKYLRQHQAEGGTTISLDRLGVTDLWLLAFCTDQVPSDLLPEDHGAVLPVEGKIVHSDGTGAVVNSRRQPVHTAIRRHQCIAVKSYLKMSINATDQKEDEKDGVWFICSLLHTFVHACTHRASFV